MFIDTIRDRKGKEKLHQISRNPIRGQKRSKFQKLRLLSFR